MFTKKKLKEIEEILRNKKISELDKTYGMCRVGFREVGLEKLIGTFGESGNKFWKRVDEIPSDPQDEKAKSIYLQTLSGIIYFPENEIILVNNEFILRSKESILAALQEKKETVEGDIRFVQEA